jgi:hypothetical protein
VMNQVIRHILQHLIDHPDAKDTIEGILKWWLPLGGGRGKEEVQKALDLLTSKGWLTKRQTTAARFYSINRGQIQNIMKYLAEVTGTTQKKT